MATIKYTVSTNGCWICTSHKPCKGYPMVKINQVLDYVHRVFYRRHNGCIPDGMIVRHTCDNTMCCNPGHLVLGTHADNVADRVIRDRSAKGENNGRAKLSKAQVLLIRGDLTTPKAHLAKQFNVDRKLIRSIQQGEIWKSI